MDNEEDSNDPYDTRLADIRKDRSTEKIKMPRINDSLKGGLWPVNLESEFIEYAKELERDVALCPGLAKLLVH